MGGAFENRFKGKCPRNWTREKKLRRERHACVLGDIRILTRGMILKTAIIKRRQEPGLDTRTV